MSNHELKALKITPKHMYGAVTEEGIESLLKYFFEGAYATAELGKHFYVYGSDDKVHVGVIEEHALTVQVLSDDELDFEIIPVEEFAECYRNTYLPTS